MARTFYVVRHAKAGDREDWPGDDRLRPLTKKGRKQAEQLATLLQGRRIAAVYSSPYVRCVQTVEPLARANRLEVLQRVELGEGHGLDGAMTFLGDPKLDRAVLSTHGDIVWELIEELVRRRIVKAGDGGYEKGSTWELQVDGKAIVGARYTPVE